MRSKYLRCLFQLNRMLTTAQNYGGLSDSYLDLSNQENYIDLSENYVNLSHIRLTSRWQLEALTR